MIRSHRTSLVFSLLAAVLLLTVGGACALAGQSAPARPAASADCNVQWGEVAHDTFNTAYRTVTGPTTPNTTVRLRLRVAQGDITSAYVRVWNDGADTETYLPMAWDSGFDTDPNTYDWWYADLAVGGQPTVYYYFFQINDAPGWCAADQDFYVDDDPKFYGGGFGAMSDGYDDSRSFQLTVYDAAFAVPSWMQQGTVYQVFPDRFRDGDGSNNAPAGRFSYGVAGGAIVRSGQSNWNFTVCDPRATYEPSCLNHYGDNFYGGDLRGVIQKLEDGYFTNLGVSVLYLNPIFRSPSNHKYDTADFMVIDPDFGTLADFEELTAKAEQRGIRVILDGVFNHTSSDSKYFDYYRRYDAGGTLVSPDAGTDDGSGACESPASTYRNWFYIGGSPASPAAELCDANDVDDTGGAWTEPYSAWYGYGSLPKLQANSTAVRQLIWSNGTASVGPYWVSKGADGWRFDVGADVDPGLTSDPANTYWEGFRSAVRAVDPHALTLGEEWGDASPWLLGAEWDSVMNYRFRSAVLSWLFTGCNHGSGCANPATSNAYFEDNDSNLGSSSGPIRYISPSQFNARLRSIAEDYPPQALKAMMNLAGSHDTNRLRFLLRKINNDSDFSAVQRMKEWWLFAFTYPGAPTLYYGDEIGLNHDGVWANAKWEDDPYNRVPFPWPDATGTTYGVDASLQDFARKMASIRWSYPALQDGDVQHGLIIDDANKLYGFARTNGSQAALIALNRDGSSHAVTFTGLNAPPYNLPDNTQLVDALAGNLAPVYTVSGGAVTVGVAPTWGAVLLEKSKIDAPATVTGLQAERAYPNVVLTWPTVAADASGRRELVTAYEVHRSTSAGYTPDGSTRIATVSPSDDAFRFGAAGGGFTYVDSTAAWGTTHYYRVCAVNAPGVRGVCSPVTPMAVTLAAMSASVQGDAIEIAWDTASEISNLGFNLYRRLSPDGPEIRLNANRIPAQGSGSPEGFHYTYLDSAGLVPGATYWYTLEDVSTAGTATRHEPVSVVYSGGPTAVSLSGFRAAAAVPAAPLVAFASIAGLLLAAGALRPRPR